MSRPHERPGAAEGGMGEEGLDRGVRRNISKTVWACVGRWERWSFIKWSLDYHSFPEGALFHPKNDLLLILHEGQASQGTLKTNDLSLLGASWLCYSHDSLSSTALLRDDTDLLRTYYEPRSFS